MYDRADDTVDEFEWDPRKARENHRKHLIRFSQAVTVFDDHLALTTTERTNGEHRLVTVGVDGFGRVLVVIWTPRGARRRVISARPATSRETAHYGRLR